MTSQHAMIRMQQRGIPAGMVDYLLAYGTERHDRCGGVIYHFDKSSRRRLERALGRTMVRKLKPFLSIYAVCRTDGTLVTVGHRHKRIYN